ncbi:MULTISPECIES: hypothetical protein [Cryptosporangium]|nr:hypothetical protein [Cryptosporangium arvum]
MAKRRRLKTVLFLTALGVSATAVAVVVARRREEAELRESGVLPLEYGAEPVLDAVTTER